MTDLMIRSTLSTAIGAIDLAVAQLSRAECGATRDLVARARVDLKGTSSQLLLLKAQFCGPVAPEPSKAGS